MKTSSITLIAFAIGAAAVVHADHSADVSPELLMTHTADAGCVIAEDLSLGSRSAAVECLQQHLIADGLLNISAPTGYFGELTRSAVREWQEHSRLPATGYFGALSRAAFSAEPSGAHTEAPEVHVMAHTPLDIAGWPSVPSVAFTAHDDAMSGFNIEIATTNFRFAPEHVNGPVLANEGHAHIYVDGTKVARVYGNWFHVPKEAFKTAGKHEIRVTLNANDHSDLSSGGDVIDAKQTITTN